MTDPLDILWATLEAVEPVLTPDAWRRLPTESRALLMNAKLFVPGPPAHRIQCPACVTPHMAPIIARPGPNGSARLFVKCPREARVLITEADRQTWRANARAVAEAVAASLALSGGVKAIRGDRVLGCGHLNWHGQRVEVCFARALCRRDGHKFAALIPRSPSPPIVFVPGEVPPEDGWSDPKPTLLSLQAVCEIRTGELAIDRKLVEHALARRTNLDLRPKHMFRLTGDYWEVTFDGSDIRHIRDSVGMGYIARLLADPYRNIFAVQLLAARAGLDPRFAWGSLGELVDGQGKRDMRREYADLTAQLAEAEKNGDVGQIDLIRQRRDQMSAELSRVLDKHGNPRRKSDAATIGKAISTAISREIDHISAILSTLGKHLRGFVNTGTTSFQYTPDREIDWLL